MANNSDKFVWFLAGAAVGAGIALLYAPKAGKDTRRFLVKKGEQARDAIVETSEDIVERGKNLSEDIVSRGREIYKKGVEIAEDANELLDRGRRLVRG